MLKKITTLLTWKDSKIVSTKDSIERFFISPYVYLCSLFLATFGLTYFWNYNPKFSNHRLITIIFVIIMLSSFIFGMFTVLLHLVKNIEDSIKLTGFFASFINLIVPLILALVLPNAIFGCCYDVGLKTFQHPGLPFFDSYYLSFVINYALPIGDKSPIDIQESINYINTDTFLRVIEIIHITLCRIIDLTIIGIVINYLNSSILNKNKKSSYRPDIRRRQHIRRWRSR